MKTIRIGYQGDENSFNNVAATRYAEKCEGVKFEYVPLRTSQNVVNALKKEEIDIGVVAIQNSIAGIVAESFEALKAESFEQLDTVILPIVHCHYIHEQGKVENINCIASHEMALKQCTLYINECYPDVDRREVEDTAAAAAYLATGRFAITTSVICSEKAGMANGLTLVKRGVENSTTNMTEFRVFKNRNTKVSMTAFQKIMLFIYSNDKPELMFKIGLFLAIGTLLLYFESYGRGNLVSSSWFLTGILGSIITLYSSETLRRRYFFEYLTGYWVYQAIPDTKSGDPKQNYAIPRIAELRNEDGKLKFYIYIANRAANPFVISTDVLTSDLGKTFGKVVYWYEAADTLAAQHRFKGIVYMDWKRSSKWKRIDYLSARYFGEATEDKGDVRYNRISEREFETIRSGEYLQ